jgi:NDP-sugar pyrophosphorylase family protein
MPETTLSFARAARRPAALSVAILAGGLGSRLRPIVADRPKVLAPVGGRPFVAWWCEALQRAEVPEAVLCTGFRADQVQAGLGQSCFGLRLQYSVEPEPLGTGGALGHALPMLQGDTVLALNGDSFCELDLAAFWAAHHACQAVVSMALAQVEDTRRFGRVRVQADRRVLEFQEKASASGPGWINAGVYLLPRRLLASAPAARPLSLERDLLPRWLPAGVFGWPAGGRFIDIGTPESYASANRFFAATAQAA